MEWDYKSFSSFLKNSSQIFGSLTEIEHFILFEAIFLYPELSSENCVEYLWLGFSNAILNIFDSQKIICVTIYSFKVTFHTQGMEYLDRVL